MGLRRKLTAVTPEDDRHGGRAGRRITYGFGYGCLSRLGRTRRRKTIYETIARGVPLHEPVVAIAWGLARRGKAEESAMVLREFGYGGRFRVARRTLYPIQPTTR